jgi:signal recognition particle subunit SRP54
MRDMYEHLQNVMKLGSMGKVMEMIPGMSQLGGLAGDHTTIVLKSFIHMLDSMTSKELDDGKVKKMLTPSRIHRIACGSGHSIAEVNNLVVSYTRFEDTVKKIGKMNFKQMSSGDPTAMLSGRAGQQQAMQLAKALNPQMLKQLGGLGGLQGMMKQLAQMKQ